MGFKVRNYNFPKNNLNPMEWNKIIKKKDTVLIDARKSFEYDVGTFKKSLNPNIENFREFPKYLNKLKNDYEKLGYSLTNINVHYQRLFSYPFYLTIMTVFGSVVMLNIKRNKSKIFHIILGIFFSVLIYYINYFSALLGENEKLPEVLSIWLPLIIISLFCSIGLVNINEK